MKLRRKLFLFLTAICLATVVGRDTLAGPFRDRLESRGQAVLPEKTVIMKDVSYGPHPKQAMDVYIPQGGAPSGMIIMVHGGAWRMGDKSNRGVVGEKAKHWLPWGLAFISINYRLLPEADPWSQAGDVGAAVAFAQKQAGNWGVNGRKVILMGHSAGAHLVALLTANPALAGARGAKRWLGTVVLDSAALDVEAVMKRAHLELYDYAFGEDEAYWRKLSPRSQLTQEGLPMLLVCSTIRKDKPCAAARVFASHARKMGIPVRIVPQVLSHGEINKNLGQQGQYTGAVDLFIRSLLEGAPLPLT